MMTNLQTFKDELYPELIDYIGEIQLFKANQNIPKEYLEYPRIKYHFSSKYNLDREHYIKQQELVDSENEDFEHDILYSTILTPQMTLTFDGYGSEKGQLMPFFRKLAQWFEVKELNREFLTDHDCVVQSVNDIQDVTTRLGQMEWEERLNLDVELQFEDIVEVRVDTIEEIQVSGPGGREQTIKE